MANKPSWNLQGMGPGRFGAWQAPPPGWPAAGPKPPFPLPRPELPSSSGLDPVGETACWVAAARAVESARSDRLFDDPYAAMLAGPACRPDQPAFGALGGAIVPYLAMRTWFLDDLIAQGLRTGIRQCVILAAGMDSRAYRLAWPEGTRVFELDRPAVLDRKAAILNQAGAVPQADRRTIAIDLTGSWGPALRDAGFDPQQPAIWLTEGLLMYLTAADVHGLLAVLDDLAAPGSRIGADIPNPPSLTGQFLPGVGERERQLAQRFGTNDPGGLFVAHGWQVTVKTPDQVAELVHRPPVPPLVLPDGHVVRNWLVAGRR